MSRPLTHPLPKIGDRFNHLVVSSGAIVGRRTCFQFTCDCGNIVEMNWQNVRRGLSKSCGCSHKEMRNSGQIQPTHGESNPPTDEYKAWVAMKSRVLIESAGNFKAYGGSGITIHDEWLGESGYDNFLAHMGRKPSPEHSLDRYPNPLGNYEPNNCRWATPKEQAQNRKTNHLLTIGDKTQCLIEWIRESGLKEGTVYGRIRRGWPTERLFEPV